MMSTSIVNGWYTGPADAPRTNLHPPGGAPATNGQPTSPTAMVNVKLPASSAPPASATARESTPDFSATPRLNDTPDPGWASWGSDPSSIRKEEEQVKRPTATYVKLQDVVSNVGRSRISNNGPKAALNNASSDAQTRHPAPTLPGGDAHAAALGRSASYPRKEVSPQLQHGRGVTSPARYPVNLPTPSFGQQAQFHHGTAARAATNSSSSTRIAHIPVAYSNRPTFRYGGATAPMSRTATAPTSPINTITTQSHQRDVRQRASPTVAQPSSSSTNSIGKKDIMPAAVSRASRDSNVDAASTAYSAVTSSPHRRKIKEKAASVNNGIVKNGDKLDRSSAEYPDNSNHQPVVCSTNADSNGPQQKTAPTASGGWSVPEGKPSAVCPSDTKSLSSSIQPTLKQFKIQFPEKLSIAKALVVIDHENLNTLGGEKVQVKIALSDKSVVFESKIDNAENREHCAFLIDIVIAALQQACPSENLKITDPATRELLQIKDSKDDIVVVESIASDKQQVHSSASTPCGDQSQSEPFIGESRQAASPEKDLPRRTEHPQEESRSPQQSLLGLLNLAQVHPKSVNSIESALYSDGHQEPRKSGKGSPDRFEPASLQSSEGVAKGTDSAVRGDPLLPASSARSTPISRSPPPSTTHGLKPCIQLSAEAPTFVNGGAGTERMVGKPYRDATDNQHSGNGEAYPWAHLSPKFPGLYEICLPLPDDLVYMTGRRCGLEEQIPIGQTAWHRMKGIYHLLDANPENVTLARKVLLVIIYLIRPSFLPSEPILELEKGTPEYALRQELFQDKQHPLRNAKVDTLAKYVISRLRAPQPVHGAHSPVSPNGYTQGGAPKSPQTTVSPRAIDNSTESGRAELKAADSRDYAGSVVSSMRRECVPPNLPEMRPEHAQIPAKDKSEIPASAVAVARDDHGVHPIHDTELSVSIQTQEPVKTSNLPLEELHRILTPSNSVCWYLPEGGSRGRFVGRAASHVKSIRQAAGIENIFWRLTEGEGHGWFLFLVGSYDPDMTDEQRNRLAYALRLCKGWAIATYAPEFLPLPEDLPTQYSEDPLFRLDQKELDEALAMSEALRNAPADQQERRRNVALSDLVGVCKRPHVEPNAAFRTLKLQHCWPGIFSELCTEQNSISWTVQAQTEISKFCGLGYSGLVELKELTSIAAIKFDANPRRYGQDKCRIYMLGSINPTLSEQESVCLLRAFRLVIAAMRVFGTNSLLPTESNTRQSKLAMQALSLACEDEPSVNAVPDAIRQTGLSLKSFEMLLSYLELDNSQSVSAIQTKSLDNFGQPPCFKPAARKTPNPDDYNHGPSCFRDIPEFGLNPSVDDGYMTTSDEEAYEDPELIWDVLSYSKKMALIGSACWALQSLHDIISSCQSKMYDSISIGPSASQVCGLASDDTIARTRPVTRVDPVEVSGWETAQELVSNNFDTVQDWVKYVPVNHKAEANDQLNATSTPTELTRDDLEIDFKGPQEDCTNGSCLLIDIPSDLRTRSAILGEDNSFLGQVSIQTGAQPELAKPENGQQEWERGILIRGQARSVNRALQMIHAGVLTHQPHWQFSAHVEQLIQGFKVVEMERIRNAPQGLDDRWSVGHVVFIPEKSIPVVQQAIAANTFVTSSCALVKLDSILIGKTMIDAPTVDQADAALVQLCDLVRNIVPAWFPGSNPARSVVETADRQSGPGIMSQLPAHEALATQQEAANQDPAELGRRVQVRSQTGSQP